MPISAQAKADMRRLQDPAQPDYMPGLSSAEKKSRLATMSLEYYLLDVAKVDKQCLWFYMATGRGVFCVGADAIPALFGWEMGVPGFAGLKLEPTPDGVLADLPGGHHGRQKAEGGGGSIHFPDGNATVARLLVRWLIPDAVPGRTQEDVGAAPVDYAKIDRAGQTARIRLSSTVVNVRHDGDPGGGPRRGRHLQPRRQARRRPGPPRRHGVLEHGHPAPGARPAGDAEGGAGLRREGAAGLHQRGRCATGAPSRSWASPTSARRRCTTTASVSAKRSASATCTIRSRPTSRSSSAWTGIRVRRASRGRSSTGIGRADLLSTSFETFERNIRDQLARTLGGGGFDPARDIAAITVNRWPHGYAYTYNSLTDPPEWVFTSSPERPCVKARQPFGSITIANSDAAASPHTDAAFLEASRAVGEVLERRAYPFVAKSTKTDA